MSFFHFADNSERYGVIIDIGSGSVLTAIVHSTSVKKHPQIVWSHREHAPLKNIDTLEKSSKAVVTSLMNSLMLLDSEGRKALRNYNSSANIAELQCSISAPWSYTATKTIKYHKEKPFTISSDTINNLTKTIETQIDTDLVKSGALENLKLQVVFRSIMDVVANGYKIKHPEGQETKNIAISYTTVLSQKYLIDTLNDMKSKLFPKATQRKLSFMIMFFNIYSQLLKSVSDVCLVDITYEATEIGIVRDGVLQYCTHVPFGSFSIAREISAVTKVPLHQAFAYLHTDKPYSFIDDLNKKQAVEINKIFDSYILRVTELFHETGDNLSIPRKILLHADLKSESLFLDLIEKAAKRATKSDHGITPVSKEIIRQTYNQSTEKSSEKIQHDTALLLSAQFFHKHSKLENHKYL